MCEKASEKRRGDPGAGDGGDSVRKLLLAVPTDRNRTVTSFSAPDFGRQAREVPMCMDDVDHRWPATAAVAAASATEELWKPPQPSSSSSVAAQQELAWNRCPVDGRTYGPFSRDGSQNQTSSCPANTFGMDCATRQQINEFEDLIDKIDQLNGAPPFGGPGRARHPGANHGPLPKCAPFDPYRPPRIERTSQSSVDDDLETLLRQNPSLLDPPTGRDGAYECDSGIDVSPVSHPPQAALPRRKTPARSDLDDDIRESMVIDEHRDWSGMVAPPSVSPSVEEVALGPPKVDRKFNVSPDQLFGHLTSPAPVRHNIGPPTSVKTATMTTRTNLKQILQMQQVRDEERKEQEKAKMKTTSGAQGGGGGNNTLAVTVPLTTNLAPRVDVPREVLKVESRLENPTRYHVMENKKRQLQEYLSTTQGTGRSLLVHSVPNDGIGSATAPGSAAPVISAQQHLSSSAPSPDSPNSVALSSSATSEADVIDSIIQMESSMDTDSHNLLQTSTVPGHTNFLEVFKLAPPSATAKSCPPAVTVKQEYVTLTADPQLQALAKDRQKKDNHNMIERRRRYKINDHIKELACLLPKSSDPFYDVIRADRQNKGNILKASVDFIKELKKEVEHLRLESSDLKKIQQENWKLRLHNQQLLNIHNQSTSNGGGSASDISYLLPGNPEAIQRVKREPADSVIQQQQQQQHHHLSETALDDFMEDDQHPVNGDPMLPSPMVNDNILLNEEMDFIS